MTPLQIEKLKDDALREWMKEDCTIQRFIDKYIGLAYEIGREMEIKYPIENFGYSGQSPCPLTNSSHEKALVRVVEREDGMYTKDVIQVLCSCGHILSECEIKNK